MSWLGLHFGDIKELNLRTSEYGPTIYKLMVRLQKLVDDAPRGDFGKEVSKDALEKHNV